MKAKFLLTIGALIAGMAFAFAQPGTNDFSFNPTDIGFGYGHGAGGHVYSTSIQSDGKIIIGGDFWMYNVTGRSRIARLNTDGTLDTSFNPGTGANGPVRTTSIQSDGKIIIGGDFTFYDGTERNRIARLNIDGSLDTSFNPGTGVNDWVWSTSIQSDGKIIIGGDFTSYNGTGRNRIARLNTDGSLDTSFSPGTGANNWVWTTSIQRDGKIIIGGDFTSFNGTGRNGVARLNTNGSLDASFNPGTGANGTVRTTSIQSDGKIIFGGRFTSFNGTDRNRTVRLNTNGSLDTSFNSGTAGNDYGNVSSISIQGDGKIIIGGLFTSYQETGPDNIARLNTDGSLDTSFNPGAGTSGLLWTISIQSDGKIILGGGGIHSYSGSSRNNVFRLHSNGSLDISFNPGTGVSGTIYSTSIQDDGKIIIGGWFDSYNGVGRNNIARLHTDGSLDTSFIPGTAEKGAVYSTVIQSDGKIIIGGPYYEGISQKTINRLNTDGSLDTSFNPGTDLDGPVRTISIQSDGKIIVGGEFTSYHGTGRYNIARLNTDGSLDTSFNPGTGANGAIYSTSIQSDGKIFIGGDFTSYNGTGRNRIARLNADGSLDASFNPGTGANFDFNTGPKASIRTISIQKDGKIIIGGRFTSFNETASVWIARLNKNGTLDTSFSNPGLDANDYDFVSTSSLQSDGKIIIGGSFTSHNEISRKNIARLNTDGSFDTCFDPGTGPGSTVYSTSIQSDGKIIIGGGFTSFNGTGRNRIARINGGECVTGIIAISRNNEFVVYPNPFTSQTVLQAAYPLSKATLSVYNASGQMVQEIKNITGQNVIMHRKNVPAGLYFVCLTENNKQIFMEKVIITD